MTWLLFAALLAVVFAEYWCTIYLTKKLFGVSENRTHFIIGSIVLFLAAFPRNYILIAFLVTSFFTPLLIWLAFRLSRNMR